MMDEEKEVYVTPAAMWVAHWLYGITVGVLFLAVVALQVWRWSMRG